MLSRPDFLQKQLVVIQAEKTKNLTLKFRNENLVIYSEGKIKSKTSLHKIFAIFIVGDFTVTSPAIRHCVEHAISLFLLKRNLEVYAEIEPLARGNFLLRHRQYHLSPDQELETAIELVRQKTANQLHLLKKYLPKTTHRALRTKLTQDLNKASSFDSLLGIEGALAKAYFAALFKEYEWRGRRPRSKPDPNNLLLDIGYTYLFNFVDALLRLYGFDTYKGVYHRLFFQRKSLACDLMEPFRTLIDHALLKAWHRGQIKPGDFRQKQGQYYLPYAAQKPYTELFLNSLLQHKATLYDYVKAYYRHVMNPTDNPFPVFKHRPR